MGVWCGCQCRSSIPVHCTHHLRATVRHGSCLVGSYDICRELVSNRTMMIVKPHPMPMLGIVTF